MKKNQLLLIIILLLIATNAYLLWYVNRSETPPEEPKLSRNERLKGWIKKDVGFSEAQADEYIELRNLRDSLLKPANAELRAAKMKIITLMNDTLATDSAIDSVMKEIAEKQIAVEKVYLAHFKRMHQLCTPEQQPRFDTLVIKMIRRNTGGGPDTTATKTN